MNKSYSIGNISFNTKKECKEFTRNVINQLGCCIIDHLNDNFEFFSDLLQNHPECEAKEGAGVAYFAIVPNPLISKYYQTMIRRIDGDYVDFSWNLCCEFKPRTARDNLLRSMRSSIKEDVIKYKQTHTLICSFCKSQNELYENYHVDHHNPSFQDLTDMFLQSTNKHVPTTFGECNQYNLTIFKDKDQEFKNDWIKYHALNSKFQILCKKCNLKKKK
jgi:hypothetical protein